MRLDRIRRDGADRTLVVRVALFFLGAGCWLAGVVYGIEWLTLAAIFVVAAGAVLGIVERRRGDQGESGGPSEAE